MIITTIVINYIIHYTNYDDDSVNYNDFDTDIYGANHIVAKILNTILIIEIVHIKMMNY